jgi:hypothetical protein
VGSNHAHGELYSIQHYVIKLVSNLRYVGDFLHQWNWSLRYNWNINPTTTRSRPRRSLKWLADLQKHTLDDIDVSLHIYMPYWWLILNKSSSHDLLLNILAIYDSHDITEILLKVVLKTINRPWLYLIKVVPEVCGVHQLKYLRFW